MTGGPEPGRRRIALVGNPNCGKTTLFNALTGAQQHVGNWPGVTVERRSGHFDHAGCRIEVVDLPGTYSLLGQPGEPPDQRVTQTFVAEADVDVFVNVVDASCLDRSLFLTSQLLDAGARVVVALNMVDVAHAQGVHVDPVALGQQLAVPVVPVVASRREGIGVLEDVLQAAFDRAIVAVGRPHLADDRLADEVEAVARSQAISPLAAEARLGVGALTAAGSPDERRHAAARAAGLIEARYAWVGRVQEGAVRESPLDRTLTDRIDDVLLGRWLGIPAFLGVMYVMFLLAINVGGAFIDFFDIAAGVLVVDTPRWLLTGAGAPAWLVTVIADGVGGGVQLVATFVPVIGALFLCLSILEDSGYMARAAFLIDRALRGIGLPGRAFVPLIVGFGCNVPAVMATRALDREQDRILTTIMAPFMSCGARLTVYALFAAAFFPHHGATVVFALYLIGIGVAVASAWMVRRFILTSDSAPFILELPPYHLPTLRGLMLQTWHKLRGFVVRAGQAIVIVVVVLNVLASLGTDGSFGNENTERSVLSAIGKQIVPVFEPMGVGADNWPAAVGVFTGIFAKEVVVGTLDALYGRIAEPAAAAAVYDPVGGMRAAFATLPENLGALGSAVADPLGFGVLAAPGDGRDVASAQGVSPGTLQAMQTHFAGPLAAFCYLLFILLYFPCVATVGAIYRELGLYWTLFASTWSLVVGYGLAVIVYQGAQLFAAPMSATAWMFGMCVLMGATLAGFVRWARIEARRSRLIPVLEVHGG